MHCNGCMHCIQKKINNKKNQPSKATLCRFGHRFVWWGWDSIKTPDWCKGRRLENINNIDGVIVSVRRIK